MRNRGTALKPAADAPPVSSAPAEPSPGSGSGAGNPPLPSFTPVPRHYRRNGWTPERQAAFIAALAETGCVAKAARRAAISVTLRDARRHFGRAKMTVCAARATLAGRKATVCASKATVSGPFFPWTLSHPSLCRKGGAGVALRKSARRARCCKRW
jgi:hypothetical protein